MAVPPHFFVCGLERLGKHCTDALSAVTVRPQRSVDFKSHDARAMFTLCTSAVLYFPQAVHWTNQFEPEYIPNPDADNFKLGNTLSYVKYG